MLEKTEPESDSVPTAKPCALFLDDDADVLAAAGLVLNRAGMALLTAQTPEGAEDILKTGAVDILLLDLNYRRGDTTGEAGLAFLRRRMIDMPHLPIVVVTGHSGMAIAVEAMRMGAQDFVVKPWNNERFVASVRSALERPRLPAPAPKPKDLNLERSERDLIRLALERHQFNISQAAKDLGVTRAALYRRMEKHGL